MTRAQSSLLAWTGSGLAVVLALGGVAAASSDLSSAVDRGSIAFTIPSLAFCAVGALVVSRLPRNPVGWLLLAFGMSGVLGLSAEEYARLGLVEQPGSLPMPELATLAIALFADWTPPALLALAFLFFPEGHLPSPRWKPVAWLVVLVCLCGSVAGAFTPGSVVGIPGAVNPIGNADIAEMVAPVLGVTGVLLPVVFLLCAASLVLRFRRTHGDERQQVKWFAFAAGMIVIFLIAGNVLESVAGSDSAGAPSDRVGIIVFPILLSAAPIAVGIAILRYRLYDIDRIISRTLSYGLLTAMLGGAYFLGVLVLQSLLPVADDSPLVVAVSTLGVVAAFGPLRSRLRGVMDHRFNRSRYDATRTIEDFGARLRSQTDLDSLSNDLVTVAHQTMQPAAVSLWLREGDASRG
ncbi:hypothetical protein BH20ACT23_BH20ACT23_25650 [soil metagenome]